MTSNEIIKGLTELIQLDHDASKTYELALKHVDDAHAEVRLDLRAFMQDHLRHVENLGRLVEQLGGGLPEPSRDLKGALLEGMTKLRSATGTLGALKAMRMNEKLTNRAYDKAVQAALPPGARDIVIAHLDDERRHLAAIEAHIARLDTVRDERREIQAESDAERLRTDVRL